MSHGSSPTRQSAMSHRESNEQITLLDESENFEDLLGRNHLFVDYFNMFLSNPSFGEHLKFNFVTGDLELTDTNVPDESETTTKQSGVDAGESTSRGKPSAAATERLKSTGDRVRERLETSIKHVIRNKKELESLNRIRLNFELKKSPTDETRYHRANPSTTNAQSRLLTESRVEQHERLLIDQSFASGHDLYSGSREELSWDRLEELARKYDASNKTPATTPKRVVRSASHTANRRRCELFRQANNHSFKDINVRRIESYLEPTSLRDPIDYLNNHVPTLNTKYTVSVLKKPFSMKWLRSRRLALFLQSDFYNEFKLAFLLAQCALFNYNSTSADLNDAFHNRKKLLKRVQVKLDDELLQMELNPFKSKNDLEKLREHKKTKAKKSEEESSEIGDSEGSGSEDTSSEEDEEAAAAAAAAKKQKEAAKRKEEADNAEKLIKNNTELYRSIEMVKNRPMTAREAKMGAEMKLKKEELKTTLVIAKDEETLAMERRLFEEKKAVSSGSNISISDDEEAKKPVVLGSVNEMAKLLVNTVISEHMAKHAPGVHAESKPTPVPKKYQSPEEALTLKFIEENYRYRMTPSAAMSRRTTANSVRRSMLKSEQRTNIQETNSGEETDEDDEENYEFMDDEYFQKKFTLELDDEPLPSDSKKKAPKPAVVKRSLVAAVREEEEYIRSIRKIQIDEFKKFLKDNDAFLFFKLWVDIEKMHMILDKEELANYIKEIKSTYNKPQILSRLNVDELDTTLGSRSEATNKYFRMYRKFQENIDYWSFEYLTETLQRRLIRILAQYWWPKFSIRLQSFDDYIKDKYPDYIQQHYLIENDINRYEKATNVRLIEHKRDNDTRRLEPDRSHINRMIDKRKDFNKVNEVDLNAENVDKSILVSKDTHLINELHKQREEALRLHLKEMELRMLKQKLVDEEKRRLRTIDDLDADPAEQARLKRQNLLKKKQDQERMRPYLKELALKYNLYENYKTSPPVGWKRPASTATLALKMLYDDERLNLNRSPTTMTMTTSTAPSQMKQRASSARTPQIGLDSARLVAPTTAAAKIRFANTVNNWPGPRASQDAAANVNVKVIEKQERNRSNKDFYYEAIYHDDVAGQIFMKYLVNKNKTFAVNRLKCLQALTKYKELFYEDFFNQEIAKKYALDLYSRYVAVSATNSIDCNKADRLKLHGLFSDSNPANNIGRVNANTPLSSFKPVYEDTFDTIEEFILASLFDEWKYFMETEDNYFNHNQIENIERSIKVRSKKLDELIGQDLVRLDSDGAGRPSLADDVILAFLKQNKESESPWDMLNFDPEIDVEMLRKMDLKELLDDSRDLEMFKKFLISHNALNDILFWMDIEEYNQIDPNDKEALNAQAKMLKKLYLNKKYFFSKNGPVDEETQNLILEKIGGWSVLVSDEYPSVKLIKLAKKHLEDKIREYWLPRYLRSDFYKEFRTASRTKMMDVVDDVLYLKAQTSQNKNTKSKLKSQRWLYSAQMLMNFSKSLRNTFTVKVFSKFLSLKSSASKQMTPLTTATGSELDRRLEAKKYDLELQDRLVNDLHFLVEVQDYKDLCQRNSEDQRALLFKMNHIIDCYINNRITPKLRIDIPAELAKEIVDKKDYVSPYIFLKPSLIIFDHLMPYWIEFNQMRSKKDLELFDEFSSFKKMKDFKNVKRADSARGSDDIFSSEKESAKWRQNQYIKALKAKLVS